MIIQVTKDHVFFLFFFARSINCHRHDDAAENMQSPPQGANVTWSTTLPPRGHGGGPAWLTASELEDREDILQDKVGRQSRRRKIGNRGLS